VLGRNDDVLDVQNDLGDVFFHALDGGELVEHSVDADGGDGGTGDGGEQGPAQGVTQGVAEAGLEGFDDETGTVVLDYLFSQDGSLCDKHEILPFGGRRRDDAGGNPLTYRSKWGAGKCLDAAALGGTDPVVRLGGDVGDGADLEARGLYGTDRGLSPGAGALDEDVNLLHP